MKSTFSPQVCERSVRLVRETQWEHETEWAAIVSVASRTRGGAAA